MEKAKKTGKSIDLKSVSSSPYFVAVVLLIVIIAIIALIVYFVSSIQDTKGAIEMARQQQAQNAEDIKQLDILRSRSEKAEAELAQYEGILPTSLGDGFKLATEYREKATEAGLTVTSLSVSQIQSVTYETTINIDMTGTFPDIHAFLRDFINTKEIRRIDSISLSKTDEGKYQAVAMLTILSEQGADYVSTPGIVDNVSA